MCVGDVGLRKVQYHSDDEQKHSSTVLRCDSDDTISSESLCDDVGTGS